MQVLQASGNLIDRGTYYVVKLYLEPPSDIKQHVEYVKHMTSLGNVIWDTYLHINSLSNDQIEKAMRAEGLLA